MISRDKQLQIEPKIICTYLEKERKTMISQPSYNCAFNCDDDKVDEEIKASYIGQSQLQI